jgi:hypothetical protein
MNMPAFGPPQWGPPPLLVDPNTPPPSLGGADASDGPREKVNGPQGRSGGFLSRLRSRPGGSDALIALGAGLLSGSNFQQGLAQGLMAYQQALRAGEDRERPQVTSVQNGAFDRTEDPVSGGVKYTANPDVQQYGRDIAESQFGYRDALRQHNAEDLLHRMDLQFGHQRVLTELQIRAHSGDEAARDAVMLAVARGNNATTLEAAHISADARPNPLEQARARRQAAAEDSYGSDVEGAAGNNGLYDQMESLIRAGRTGAGPGVLNSVRRSLATTLGIPVGGVDPGDSQLLQQGYRQMELRAASIMRGQGQVTEAERRILQQSVASISTDPEAAMEYIRTLRQAEQRRQQIWDEAQDRDPSESFRAFVARRTQELIQPRSRTTVPDSNRAHMPTHHSAPRAGNTNGVSWRIVN